MLSPSRQEPRIMTRARENRRSIVDKLNIACDRLGMLNINDEIRSKTEAFANQLGDVVRRAALESVSAALGGVTVTAPIEASAKRGPGRPKKVISPAPAETRAAAHATKMPKAPAKAAPPSRAPFFKKAAAPKRASGEKRPPAE